MPPQPLSHYHKRQPGILAGPEALEQRPQFAIPIAQVITIWAHLDTTLATILARMTGDEAVTAVAMYAAIRKESARLDALDAAAKLHLERKYYQLFSAVLRVIRNAAKHRNRFAHAPIGRSNELPDCILFLNDEDIMLWSAAILAAHHPKQQKITPGNLDHSNVIVYTIPNAIEAVNEVNIAYRAALRFSDILWHQAGVTGQSPDATYDLLCSLPQIRQFLSS